MDSIRKTITESTLATQNLLDTAAIEIAIEVLGHIEAQNTETVRVLFSDQHGILRGKTIAASKLVSIIESGMAAPSALLLKDTAHITVFPVWSAQASAAGELVGACDVLMVPDPSTFRQLPWSPHSAWLMCDLHYESGALIPFAPGTVLKHSIEKLQAHDKAQVAGLEVEFHVFKLVDAKQEHKDATMPGQAVLTRNLAKGYQFLTETRYDQLEDIMDTLRRHCIELGLPVTSMEVEMGPSQFEFTFDPMDPITHANNRIMFRTMGLAAVILPVVLGSCYRYSCHAGIDLRKTRALTAYLIHVVEFRFEQIQCKR